MIDEEVEDAMKELKVELAKKLKKGVDETEEGAEEEEWMDVEDDDEEMWYLPFLLIKYNHLFSMDLIMKYMDRHQDHIASIFHSMGKN